MSDTYALLMVNELPHRLFVDAAEAQIYAERHDRIDIEDCYVWWPVRVQGE